MDPTAEQNESPSERVNVADRLAEAAAARPDAVALAAADGRGGFQTITLGELDQDATLLARGLVAHGVEPGLRIALLVRPGIEFVTLVFALLRSGATLVLVDAGLGRKNIVRCLASTRPDGFVGIAQAHLLRQIFFWKFWQASVNVAVGGGKLLALWNLLLGCGRWVPSLVELRLKGIKSNTKLPTTRGDDPAAIVFTSGSTGPPKGVCYTHQTFVTQCDAIRDQYDIKPGDRDLACFPLFGLFNVACGVTTVLPEMDFSCPASCDVDKLLFAAQKWEVNQAFASPAVWDKLSRHCEQTGESIPTLRKVLSCGAPVTAPVLQRTLASVHPEATMHTPYGATESLPVATIEAQEILGETAAATDLGHGVCVGKPFTGEALPGFEWRILPITDEPIASLDEAKSLPVGEIGELAVCGPQVSRRYLVPGKPDEEPQTFLPNRQAKIIEGDKVWHRMGDVGYLDQQGRFWYAGRKSQRVVTPTGTLYTECVEQLANSCAAIRRTALVGIGDRPMQVPVLVVEPESENWLSELDELAKTHPMLAQVEQRIAYKGGSLPTDIRHNAKIRREELAAWAAGQLRGTR